MARLAWASVAVVIWPFYYTALLIRWLVPWPLAPLERVWSFDDRLHRAVRSPPFVHRLRG